MRQKPWQESRQRRSDPKIGTRSRFPSRHGALRNGRIHAGHRFSGGLGMAVFSIARSVALSAFSIGLSAGVAIADTITVHGTVLDGEILAITEGSVRFETVYGKGAIEIELKDIQAITTDKNYLIVFGDDERAHGRILGVEQQHLVLGDDPESAALIPIDSIITGVSVARYDSSLLARLRQDYHYWKANFDVAIEFEDGVVDKRKYSIGVNVERKKKPTRFVTDLRVAFEDQGTDEVARTTTKDEANGFILGELDWSESAFIYGFGAVERDALRSIDSRAYPHAGIGYRFIDAQNALFQISGGLGYVYEDFSTIPTNEYVAAALGLEVFYEFDSGIEFRSRIDYLPSVSAPTEDWLYRSTAELSWPLVDPISLKIRMTDIYDNNPAPNIGNNKFTTSAGISFRF